MISRLAWLPVVARREKLPGLILVCFPVSPPEAGHRPLVTIMSPRHHVHDAAGDLWRPLQVTFSPTAIRLGADRREVRRAEGLAAVVELIQAGRPELELSDSAAGGVR